jgi:hypothetical protein
MYKDEEITARIGQVARDIRGKCATVAEELGAFAGLGGRRCSQENATGILVAAHGILAQDFHLLWRAAINTRL